jgi:uncharacterized protein (TIGR02118 family)
MIVVFSLMRRRDDVPLDEFRRHWLDPHGPLVCRFARLRRYSQNHVIDPDASPMRVDGFAELAYDTDADQEAATGSPEMAACDRDSPLFIGSVLRVVTQDHVILHPPTNATKQITVFTGTPGTVASALARYHDVVRTIANVTGLIENTALRQRGPRSAVPVLDVTVGAIVETWFATDTACRDAALPLTHAAGPQAFTYAVTDHRFVLPAAA